MGKTIPQRELQHDNTEMIEAVLAGETFVITWHGEPVAELRPLRPGRRVVVPRDEVLAGSGTGVRIDPNIFRHDLDRLIDQGP